MATGDVVVIGGGIIGCAVAWRLASQGASVALVERGQPGREASWAAGGALIPEARPEVPAPLLAHWLASLAMYPEFVDAVREESGVPFEFRTPGRLVVAFDPGHLDALTTTLQRQGEAGVHAELWSAEQVREAEPSLAPGALGGLFFPDHGVVDNRQLVAALAIAAARRGVAIHTGRPVTRVLRSGDRAVGVDACGERYHAGAVVNAAGCWAGLVDPDLLLPVAPAKGQILALQARPPVTLRLVSSAQGALAPRADGRLVFGSTVEDVGYDTRVTAAGIQYLLAGLVRLYPALADATLLETWAGVRPLSVDRLPIVGAGPLDGLYAATGHFSMGILSAPATAEALAGLILSGRSPLPIDAFSPLRFARREEAMGAGTAC